MKLLLALSILLLSLISCVSKRGIEPKLYLDLYGYDFEESTKTGRVLFVSADKKKRIDTDEPTIHEMLLLPATDIQKMQDKIDRCEVWRD